MAGDKGFDWTQVTGFIQPTFTLIGGIVATATGAGAAQGVPLIGQGAMGIVNQGLIVGGVIPKDQPATDSTGQVTQLYKNVPVEQQVRVNDQLVSKQMPQAGKRITQDSTPAHPANTSKALSDEQLRTYYENIPLSERIKIASYLRAQQMPKAGQRIATDPPAGLKITKAEPKAPTVSRRDNFPSVDLPVNEGLPEVSGSSEVSSRSDFPSVDLPDNEPTNFDFPEVSGSSEVSSRSDFPSTDLSEDNGGNGGDNGGDGGSDYGGGETAEA